MDENISYNLNKNTNVFTIYGTGEVNNLKDVLSYFNEYIKEIVIEEGITGLCDNNGQAGYTKTAITTTMTISLSALQCTTNNTYYKPYTFTDELVTIKQNSIKDRTLIITYFTKKSVQKNFESKATEIVNALAAYLSYWSYPPYIPASWSESITFTSAGVTYLFKKYASCVNGVITYGINCSVTSCVPNGNKYVKTRKFNFNNNACGLLDTLVASTNLANVNGVNLLAKYNTKRTYTYSGNKFTTYIGTITNTFSTDIEWLKKTFTNKIGLVYIPTPEEGEIKHTAPNGVTYTIKYKLTLSSGVGSFKATEMSIFVNARLINPVNGKEMYNYTLTKPGYKIFINSSNTGNIVYGTTILKYFYECKCNLSNYNTAITTCMDKLLQERKNSVSNVIGQFTCPESTGSIDAFFEGIFYYRAYLYTASTVVYHKETSHTFSVHLKYGTSKNNYTKDFSSQIPTKSITIRGGSYFVNDLKQFDAALKSAVEKLKESFPQSPTLDTIGIET